MIRWEDVKSLKGVVGGSGNLSRKSGASRHWDTVRNGKTGMEGGRGGAGDRGPGCFICDDTGVMLGVEVVC